MASEEPHPQRFVLSVEVHPQLFRLIIARYRNGRIVLPTHVSIDECGAAYSGWAARASWVLGRRAASLKLKFDITAATDHARFRIAPPPLCWLRSHTATLTAQILRRHNSYNETTTETQHRCTETAWKTSSPPAPPKKNQHHSFLLCSCSF
eukprot:2888539-Amphidinium_carterae.1